MPFIICDSPLREFLFTLVPETKNFHLPPWSNCARAQRRSRDLIHSLLEANRQFSMVASCAVSTKANGSGIGTARCKHSNGTLHLFGEKRGKIHSSRHFKEQKKICLFQESLSLVLGSTVPKPFKSPIWIKTILHIFSGTFPLIRNIVSRQGIHTRALPNDKTYFLRSIFQETDSRQANLCLASVCFPLSPSTNCC